MSDWNSNLYLKFESERTRPAIDLADSIGLNTPRKIIDLGCGPGNSTAVLSARFPDADITGADNSPDMIAKARSLHPDLDFIELDVSRDLSVFESDFDIVFSNACLQWIPDHRSLIPRLMKLLVKGGVLAVQIPVNYDEPIHRIIRDVASRSKWRGKISSLRPFNVLTESEYFNLLFDVSSDFKMWKTVYYHQMPSCESIMDWYRGTGLRPYTSQLDREDATDFESDVFSELVSAYPHEPCGDIMFSFPRLFFTASR